MCGIIGVAGAPAFDTAFAGLKALEYRGYDSFGFAGLVDEEIGLFKKVGAISESSINEINHLTAARTLVGHTRWATHGRVVQENAHPHSDHQNRIALAHNGVIANFAALKVANPQWDLSTETDSEVAANVIADAIEAADGDLKQALRSAIETLEGEFAICGIVRGRQDTIFAIKRKSPLILGQHGAACLVASDRAALAEFAETMPMAFLDDDCLVVFEEGDLTAEIREAGLWQTIELGFEKEDLSASKADLEGYPHFMLKEINESAEAVTAMRSELAMDLDAIVTDMQVSEVSMTGSGSSYYVSMIGQYFFRSLAHFSVPTYPSDEYLNLRALSRRDLVMAISQSGETFDTLEVFREAIAAKAGTIAINNVTGSSMQRLAEYPIFQNSGKEVCVLSTKSVISQISALYLMAAELGLRNGFLRRDDHVQKLKDYTALPDVLRRVIAGCSETIKRVAYHNSRIEHWFFIGRGAHYPVALESALKFKEVSYLHAEGMPAGFFKHGTISMIDDNFYTVVFLPSPVNAPALYQLTLDNIYEIRARGGKVIAFGHGVEPQVRDELFYEYIDLPDLNAELNTLIQLTAGQLFAYYCAVSLNRNIDKPRALAKSVTVR